MLPIQKCEFTVGNTAVVIIMQGGFSCDVAVRENSPHSHPNLEVHYVANGETSFFSGETGLTLLGDTLVIVPPKHYHFFNDNENTVRVSFEVKLSRAKDGRDTYPEHSALLDSVVEPMILSKHLPEFLSLYSCAGIIKSEEQLCRVKANLMLCYLTVAELLRSHSSLSPNTSELAPALLPTGDENVTVIKILNYINANYCLPITLADVAREVSLSERQVQRILADKMHEGFHALLTKQRINNARLLLSSPDEKRTLEEIAYASGFSSYVSFWSHFKRATGETPDAFRRRRR